MFLIPIFTCSDLGNNESVFKDTQDTGGNTDMLVPSLPAKLLQSCPNLCSPTDCVTHQASLSMGLKKGIIPVIKAEEGVEKRKPSHSVSGNVIWYSHFGKQHGGASEN